MGTGLHVLSDKGDGANLTVLRMLRVLRIIRAVRVVRLVRFFKDMRMMVLSILNSFATLLWAFVLLMILIFMFGILLTQNVTSYLYADSADAIAKNSDQLHACFGSVYRAAYTLFKAITGGITWEEVGNPLFDVSWTNGLLFCFYIFFAIFAMLNIITAIFLESAIA